VKLTRTIRREIRKQGDGVNVAATVNAAIAASVDEPGATETSVSSHSTIVQRDGRTVVDHTTETKEERHER
jgi:hypothetical protein